MNLVIADIKDDGVSAAPTPENAGLADVVAEAKQKGIDLKIVVVDRNPPIDTPLRDIATEVGEAYPGLDGAGAQPDGVGHLQHDL